jgi:hypothetical protein
VIAFKPAVATPELASARLRGYLPCKYLQQAGWACEMYQPAHVEQYHTVVFLKAYAPEDLELAERLRRQGTRTIFDLCDNHFHDPEQRPVYRERAERLRRMIHRVDAITVSTPELAKLVPRPSTVIDDALDEIRADWTGSMVRWFHKRFRRPLRLVWFGNAGHDYPRFGMIDLKDLLPILNRIAAGRAIHLSVISNSRDMFAAHMAGANFPVAYHEFQTATFQRTFRSHDVCLIPVEANPFTVCKTINRPALSLLLGVPVVCDMIPSYRELDPYVCSGDWLDNLNLYAANRSYRQAMVRRGQRYLRGKYTPDRVVGQWSGVFGAEVAACQATSSRPEVDLA